MRSYGLTYAFDQFEDAYKTASETPTRLSKTICHEFLSRPHTSQSSRVSKNRLNSHKLVLTAKSELRKLRESKALERASIENTMRKEIHTRLRRLLRMETASIMIQKHIRGYLVRKQFEKIYIEYCKLKINRSIDDLRNLSNTCFYNSGAAAHTAALVIQRSYRRYRVRCIIARLIYTHEFYIMLKNKAAEQKIQQVLPYFVASLKVKEVRREELRLKRIEEFRRKRAAGRIRRYCKKIGLTYKLFMKKVTIYKKRLEQTKLKQAVINMVSQLSVDNRVIEEAKRISGTAKNSRNSSPKVNTGLSLPRANMNLNSDFTTAAERATSQCKKILNLTETSNSKSESPIKEVKSSIQMREDEADLIYDALQELYRVRLEQTKTSYGIRDLKLTKVKPILSKLEDESEIQPTDFCSLFPMFAMKDRYLDRMKSILPCTPKRDTLNESSPRSRSKRKPTVCVEESSYMKSTQATQHRFEFTEEEVTSKSKRYIKSTNRLMNSTISYSNKTRIHTSFEKGRKPFCVAARKDPEFMPVSRQIVSRQRKKRLNTTSAGFTEEDRNALVMRNKDHKDTIQLNPFKRCFRSPLFEYKKIRISSAKDSRNYYFKDFI